MSEDMAVTLARLEELTTTTPEGDPLDQPLRLFGYEVVATLLKHIRELQKRIGELEAERDTDEMARGALNAIQTLLDSGNVPRGTFADDQVRNLVAMYNNERQRREEVEELLRKFITPWMYEGLSAPSYEEGHAYFSRHPSSSGNEPGNGRSK